jgi:hypothetical protein
MPKPLAVKVNIAAQTKLIVFIGTDSMSVFFRGSDPSPPI